MPKFKKQNLEQMIEKALSYEQDEKISRLNSFYKMYKGTIINLSTYGLTFASLIISFIFIPQIVISRNIVDINEINDFVTYGIIEDL